MFVCFSGLIFGIWNSHTSLGNILGTLIAAAFVTQNWALSFIIPGMIIAAMGIVVLFFMVPEPMMVGLPNPNLKKEVGCITLIILVKMNCVE